MIALLSTKPSKKPWSKKAFARNSSRKMNKSFAEHVAKSPELAGKAFCWKRWMPKSNVADVKKSTI